jgi:uncharacterized protein (DUF1697 family)
MPKYAAFLRAINLGGHTVKMDELRRMFEGMGFSHVETFIASGNVIFESDSTDSEALEQKIEADLKTALGYHVATFLRTPLELGEITRRQPFLDPELAAGSSVLYIAFLASEPTGQAVQKLLGLASPVNQFSAHGREVYWLCRTKFSDSGFTGAQLEKALGMPATIRNSSTVKKIAEKYA